ncbi:DUF2470 domain-containing protein [Glycomyces paridis]|uniref:DUF2470 domain-containing protein n=1 Tax=Glycomyces paridis TaxID=2126555 RepID=A0A4S8PAK1_9ACTN|nr:DUF2470 domain-containing protein [Glycomyces paridis]THV27290.1 DUF2470 domain-containing protein [Glycomyces paridis]
MRPTAAEVARTLARGRLEGTLKFADGSEVGGFGHATDRSGRPLLLARGGGDLAKALHARAGSGDRRARLTVDDVPPVPGAPSLGRLRVSGSLWQVPQRARRNAVLEFAESNPLADLFDVGTTVALHVLEIQRVTLDRSGSTEPIAPAAYSAAEPDPLHECEQALLEDLADHHGTQLGGLVRRLLDRRGAPCGPDPRAVRLDRYGFTVDIGPEEGRRGSLRLEFARAVRDQHDLAHLLHPILFHDHHGCEHD